MELNKKLLKHFSDQIKKRMDENSVSQTELSKLSGLTQSQISGLINMTGNPTLKTLAKAISALS